MDAHCVLHDVYVYTNWENLAFSVHESKSWARHRVTRYSYGKFSVLSRRNMFWMQTKWKKHIPQQKENTNNSVNCGWMPLRNPVCLLHCSWNTILSPSISTPRRFLIGALHLPWHVKAIIHRYNFYFYLTISTFISKI